MISIKRFIQNKNTVTIIALLACIGIIYVSYNARIKAKTRPVNVPYATKEIGPRTLITNDMVAVKKVPGGIVTENVYRNTDEIVGKYVINTGVVPEGGLFFNSMVVSWEELPKSLFDDIAEGNTVYTLPVDSELTYGNSIFPGNYIDIYFKATNTDDGTRVWVGKFIENIQVLAVLDSSGKSVFETNGNPGVPSKLMFSVDNEMYELLVKIEKVGRAQLFPVQRSSKFTNSEEPKQMKVVGSEFVEYINRYAIDID